MPHRRHAGDESREESKDNSSSSSSSSSNTKIAFYDTTSYFREFFTQVTHDLSSSLAPLTVSYKWIESRLTSETVDLCQGCSVICVFVSDQVDADIATQLHKQGVKMIAIRAAGFNNIDIGKCDELGLTVARVPAYSPYAVAEMATTLILALNRKVHHAYARVRDYNFSLDRLVGFDMHGKTVGVLGTGKIGQCFIDIMLGFGCHVLCYDIVKVKALEGRRGVKYTTMESVFQQSDIISLHLPLTPDTKHLISAKTLKWMKPTALIINTGRGELIDTTDLIEALRQEKLGGAGLDVYEEEGEYFYSDMSEVVMKDRELLEIINQPNCIVTSHQAFLTREALEAIGKVTLENVKEFVVEGKKMGELKNSVNKTGGKKGKGEGEKKGEGGKGEGKGEKTEGKDKTDGDKGQGEGKQGGVRTHPTAASYGQSHDTRMSAEEVRRVLNDHRQAVEREKGHIQFLARM